MSNKKNNAKVEKTVETVVENKTKSMGLESLLKSDLKGHKLAGVLKMFGSCELVRRDVKKQTISNKVSKAGLKLRNKSDEEIDSLDGVAGAMEIISKNFGVIKTCMLKDSIKDLKFDEETELYENDPFTEELQGAYDTLLGHGGKDKMDAIPDTMEF